MKLFKKYLSVRKYINNFGEQENPPEYDSDIARVKRRREFALSYFKKTINDIDIWAKKKTEDSNFYYKISQSNREYLGLLIAHITSKNYKQIIAYFEEVESDKDLQFHFSKHLENDPNFPDIEINYARRIGWYAFARALKPKLIIETGVDLGVGSCILCSALLRNKSEGFDGRYIGTEIRLEAGELLNGQYRSVGEIQYGDSIESLKKLNTPIDIFINDSDHSDDYEFLEYEAIKSNISPRTLILGDNSHVTNKLAQFSLENDRDFIFFAEKPENHWYPGAGIGISFTPNK
jgi:hypothetical protein